MERTYQSKRKRIEKLLDFGPKPVGMTNKNKALKLVILGLDPGIQILST